MTDQPRPLPRADLERARVDLARTIRLFDAAATGGNEGLAFLARLLKQAGACGELADCWYANAHAFARRAHTIAARWLAEPDLPEHARTYLTDLNDRYANELIGDRLDTDRFTTELARIRTLDDPAAKLNLLLPALTYGLNVLGKYELDLSLRDQLIDGTSWTP